MTMTRATTTRVSAILSTAGLMAWALYLGHDGVLLAGSLAIIGGIAGYEIGLDKVKP